MSGSSEAESVLLFFCLFIVYAGTSGFCLLRIIKLHKFAPQWRKAQIFYVLVLVQVVLRSICLIILASQISDLSVNMMFLLISVPDSLFLLSYILLIWQLVSLYYFAHIEDHSRQTFISKISRKPKTSTAGLIVMISIIAFAACQGMLYFLTIVGLLTINDMAFELDILNLAIPGSSLLLMLGLSIKYSGVPLKSPVWRKRFSQIWRISFFWSITRLFRGIISIIGQFSNVNLAIDLQNSNDNTTDFIFLVVILIVSEVLCVFSVQDYGFMGIFIFSEEEESEPSTPAVSKSTEENEPEIIANTSISISQYNESVLINLIDITEGEEIVGRKNGLGKLYNAKFKDSDVLFRKISLPRLSGYVIEELTTEIELNRNTHFPNVLPVISAIIELPIIGFITPVMREGSLHSILHEKKKSLSLTIKLKIAEVVARELYQVHSQAKAHGHLTSHNILLDSQLTPYISDLGFHKVKKYAGIVSGYTNISSWSSPELLNNKRSTPIKALASDDSYSFGMILWEMLVEQEPFPGFTRKQLITNIVEQGNRPLIPQGTPEDIVELILKCWNPDPLQRPDMGFAHHILSTYNEL